MHFSKYVGSGNDFILIDNRDLSFPSHDLAFISKLCHRQFGIGADGVILLENAKTADFKMRIFNADGSEAEMCGNGIRCFFKFIRDCGIDRPSYLIETKEAQIKLEEGKDEHVKVSMQQPFDVRFGIDLTIDLIPLKIHFLNTGVPHAVIFLDEIKDSDLKDLAPKIRFHPEFFPKGTNVNFVTITGKNEIAIRTYERGVENETLGCGTGACASAIATAHLFGVQHPVQVKTKSGEKLEIDFKIDQKNIKDVTMSGPALFVYSGDLGTKKVNQSRNS